MHIIDVIFQSCGYSMVGFYNTIFVYRNCVHTAIKFITFSGYKLLEVVDPVIGRCERCRSIAIGIYCESSNSVCACVITEQSVSRTCQ